MLTDLDKFAIAALARGGNIPGPHNQPEMAAYEAYELAEAMLAEKEKRDTASFLKNDNNNKMYDRYE